MLNNTELILDFSIFSGDHFECLSELINRLEKDKKVSYLVCANSHSLETAQADVLFHKALCEADFLVPDGIGIIFASRILGGTINARITGSDIFQGVSGHLNKLDGKTYSCFFLGSTEETLAKIQSKMAEDFPNVKFAGSYSPPFKPEFTEVDNRLMIEAVNAAKADILWVGLTAPKQEKWIYQNKDKLNVKFVGAIGAVFDFYAGNVKRSHSWFQKHGLEWLPRFIREPRRLWRRNFISNPLFMLRVLKARIKRQLATPILDK